MSNISTLPSAIMDIRRSPWINSHRATLGARKSCTV